MAAFDLPVNDTHLSSIFSDDFTSARMRSAMERADAAAASSVPVIPVSSAPEPDPEHLPHFVSNVPPIVTRLLVETAPFLARLRWALQVASWKSGSYSESWLTLAAFWAVCLWLHFTVRYFFPILLCAPYIAAAVYSRLRPSKLSAAAPEPEVVVTEATIQGALSDVSIIYHLLPARPTISHNALPPLAIVRLVLVSYLLYVITIWALPPNAVIALAGSFVLTWRAHWAKTVRGILVANGWVRFISRRAFQLSTGTAPPLELSPPAGKLAALSKEGLGVVPDDVPPPSKLRVRFSVLENQRWWMGLDWTAALLPQERASWTSAPPALKAVPPPMAISLPASTTVYLPLPGKKDICMKRTATWSWADTAWGAIVRLSAAGPSERVVMALPKVDGTALDEHGLPTVVSTPGPAEGLLQRGLQRIGTVDLGIGTPKGGTGAASSHPSRTPSSSGGAAATAGAGARSPSPEANRRRSVLASEDGGHHPTAGEHHGGDVPTVKEEEESGITDAEGWIYTDNKWETPAPKNGIGKFTRTRRWTRIALLTETVEIVPASENPAYVKKSSKTAASSPTSPNGARPPISPTRPTKALPTAAPTLATAPGGDTSSAKPPSPTVITTQPSGLSMSSPLSSPTKERASGSASALRQRLQKVVDGSAS